MITRPKERIMTPERERLYKEILAQIKQKGYCTNITLAKALGLTRERLQQQMKILTHLKKARFKRGRPSREVELL